MTPRDTEDVALLRAAAALCSLVAVCAFAACSDSALDEPVASDAQTPAEPKAERDLVVGDELGALRELGYVDWDEGADEALKSVTKFDAERTAPGFNLYTDDVDEVILLGLDGKRVHSWKLPGRKFCEFAELLPNGLLAVVCNREGLVLLNWDGSLVWEHEIAAHHDVAFAPDGSFWVPFIGSRRSYRGRTVKFDSLAQISADGERLRAWSTFDHLDELQPLHEPSALDTPPAEEGLDAASRDAAATMGRRGKKYDYYHLNTVEVLPDTPLGQRDGRFRAGNLLLCLRNANLVVILDRDDLSVVWHWDTGTLDAPHMPTMLENGNILIFDNGYERGFSRILELEPISGQIVWSYEAVPREAFFSDRRGSSQRLPNGNTLICESERGHVFEVTPEGETVWEFWNPEIEGGKRKRIYRFMRVPAALVESRLAN